MRNSWFLSPRIISLSASGNSGFGNSSALSTPCLFVQEDQHCQSIRVTHSVSTVPPSPAEAGSGNQRVSCNRWESRLRLLSVDPFVLALILVTSGSGKDPEADYTIHKSFWRQEGGETAGEH